MCSVKHCRIHYLKQFIDCPDIVRFFPSFCRVRVASLILSRQWTKWDSGCKPIPWQWPIRNDFILSISKSINETEHDQISLCMTWWWEMWPGWAHFLTHSLPCRVCVCFVLFGFHLFWPMGYHIDININININRFHFAMYLLSLWRSLVI